MAGPHTAAKAQAHHHRKRVHVGDGVGVGVGAAWDGGGVCVVGAGAGARVVPWGGGGLVGASDGGASSPLGVGSWAACSDGVAALVPPGSAEFVRPATGRSDSSGRSGRSGDGFGAGARQYPSVASSATKTAARTGPSTEARISTRRPRPRRARRPRRRGFRLRWDVCASFISPGRLCDLHTAWEREG